MNENSEFIVRGYCFGSAQDAEMAKQEVTKIEYLEQHMDYEKSENMLMVYRKAIESRVFNTPIGWEYMRELQKKLYSCEGLEEEIPPVTLYTVFAHRVGDEIRVPAPRIPPKKKNTLKRNFIFSVLTNILLVMAVCAMFYIAMTNENPNILNYENILVNKYATWEQELSERENIVREKERELIEQ